MVDPKKRDERLRVSKDSPISAEQAKKNRASLNTRKPAGDRSTMESAAAGYEASRSPEVLNNNLDLLKVRRISTDEARKKLAKNKDTKYKTGFGQVIGDVLTKEGYLDKDTSIVNQKADDTYQNKVTSKSSSRNSSQDVAGLKESEKEQNGNFISFDGNYISGDNLADRYGTAAIDNQRFADEMSVIDRQTNFYRDRNTTAGEDALRARINRNRQAVNSLGTQVDSNGYTIKRDSAGNILSPQSSGYMNGSPVANRSTRLDFGNEGNNPFVAGINNEGVTYARGSRMDKQIQRKELTDRIAKQNPNVSTERLNQLVENEEIRNSGLGLLGERIVIDREKLRIERENALRSNKTKEDIMKTTEGATTLGELEEEEGLNEDGRVAPTGNFTLKNLPGVSLNKSQIRDLSIMANSPEYRNTPATELYRIYMDFKEEEASKSKTPK